MASWRNFELICSACKLVPDFKTIADFRHDYARSFRVEDVAKICGMSVSAFYRNFQAATAMSPIQFQKQIRLREARLLLAAAPDDVAGVGYRVGYDSPSQFSREYRRQFGVPPSQDAQRLRTKPVEVTPTTL